MSKVFKNNPQQSKLILEELEERRLFSGGIEGLIASELDPEAQAIYADADKAKAANANDEASAAAAEQQTHEIVFVDAGVDNYQQLVDDLHNNADSSRNIEVVVLDQDKDGIEEISEFLSHREDLDAIHIISHGSDGSVELGNTSLNAATLEQNNLKIALWANNFADTGDILIYGCNLAGSEAGQSLIDELGALTLTDVAASTDLTGHADLGGDWALEFSVGTVESRIAVSAELQQEYQGTFATYTVTSLADSGAGSLREAIGLANGAGGADTIEFGVAGTISLSSALPTIDEQLTIDGSTAPGYSGDPVVEIDGSGVSGNGLRFTSGADDSTVNALMITNFTGNGIQIDNGADGITITGNWIGTTGTGTTGDGNSNNGINVQGANTVIGGTGANDGNVITNNGNEGINLTGTGATGTLIQGNIIGLDSDGITGSGNGDVGIALLSGSHNTIIGGTDPNAGNIISMNFEGIEINSNNNTLQGNYIGTDITGTLDRGNDSDDGIEIKNNATGNLIGGTDPGAGNLIAFNQLDGVNLVNGSSNTVLGNDIHSNGDQQIDLAAGANGDQAAPLLTSAQTNGSELTVSGSLSSTANSYFRIEFFGANQTYLGFVNVATDGSGNATFETTLSASVASGTLITSSATKSDAAYSTFTDTSAFSSTVVSGNSGTAIWRDASTTPQTSDWDGSAFGSTTATAPSGDYRIMQGAESPTRDEIIIIGVDESSEINGEIWDGSSWSTLPANPLGTVTQSYWWSMDVAYEQQSGDAVMVWADGTELKYSTWDGSSWTAEAIIQDFGGTSPRQIQLAAQPSGDEMVMVVSDSSGNDTAWVWDGSNWTSQRSLDTSGGYLTSVYVAYEQQSGDAMVTYAKSGDVNVYYQIWDGTSWSAEASVAPPGGVTSAANWVTLGSDPGSDRIVMGVVTSGGTAADIWLSVWNGTAWETSVQAETTATESIYPNVAVAFESTSGQALAAYGEDGSNIVKYRTWDSGSGWSSEQTGPNIGGEPNSLILAADPISDQIMLSAQDANSHVNYVLWNGSSWGAVTELGTSTTEVKNQPFLFLWDQQAVINDAPVNAVPATQNTAVDTALIFSSANGNAISVADTDDTGVEVTLSATNGVLTLNGTTGLSFSVGDGVGDTDMTFSGTLADINAALDGLQFDPTAAFEGFASVQISTTDSGAGGAASPENDTDAVTIEVGDVNSAPVNTVPAAQTVNQDGMLLFSGATGTAITISDADAGGATIQVTLAATNGTLNLQSTSGLSFSVGDGSADTDMTFTGTIADINAALEGMTFLATPGFTGAAGVQITTDDLGNSGAGGALVDADSVAITVQAADQKLWLTLKDDIGASGDTENLTTTGGDVLTYGDISQLETSNTDPLASTTSGTLAHSGFNLDTVLLSDGVTQASDDGNTQVNAVHAVTADIQVGSNNIQLLAGDILLSTNGSETIGGVTYDLSDVFVFRPDTAGDYTQGSFFLLIDGSDVGLGRVTAVSLVEQSTVVGDTTLAAGEFLLAHDNSGKNVVRFTPGSLGATTSGSTSVLLAGADIDIGQNIGGIHLLQADTELGGQSLGAGQLLVSLQANDSTVGSGTTIDVKLNDIFVLDVTATGSGTTVATASRLVEGLDENLDSGNEAIWGIGYQGNAAPTVSDINFSVDENSANGTVVGTVIGNDPEDGASVNYAITDGNTGGAFAIDATTGQITVADSTLLDFETTPSFSLTVAAVDSQGAYDTATVTIDLNNLSEAGVNDAPENTLPAVQTIQQDGMLVFSAATGTEISISDFDAASGSLEVTLDATNGTLNLSGTSGLLFSVGDGSADTTMTFTGTLADINAALEGMTFVATPGFTGAAGLQITTDDQGNTGTGGALVDTDSVAIDVIAPDSALWLTFENDEGGTGSSEIPSITGGDIVTYSDITQLETSNSNPLAATSTGTLAYGFNLDTVLLSDGLTLASDGNTAVNAVHYVGGDFSVGGINLQAGDLLLSADTAETIDGVTYEKEDVFVFRPDTVGDYSQGSFFRLIDGKNDTGWGNVTAITLVEQDTVVGGVTLSAGEFLVAHDGDSRNILRFTPGSLGDTTTGTTTVFVAGGDIDIGQNIGGLHLVQNDTELGGASLTAGQLLVSLQGNDSTVGSGTTIDVLRQDIFVLDVSATGVGTSVATASRLFEGLDENLDNNNESVWGIGFQANAAPEVTANTFALDENSANSTVVGSVSATDPELGTLAYAITGGNTDGAFAIDASTGQITVANSTALDFETTPTFNLTVAAIDPQGAYGSATITVNLNDLIENQAPTDLVATSTTNSGVTLNADGGNDVYFVADDGGALLGGLTTVTIEASFAITSPVITYAPILSYADGSNDEELAILLEADGTIRFGASSNGSVLQDTTGTYTQLFDGNVHHVGVSWDSATGAVDFYVDGTLVESFSGYQTGQTITGTGELVFGQDQDSVLGNFNASEVFSGTLYDIRIFDDVRTSGEIGASYDQTLPSTEAGMIANWVFDDLSVNGVVTDTVSGNNLTQQQVVGAGFTTSVAELNLQVFENAANGTVVGNLATLDPDSGDTFTYSLQDNAGGRFAINASNGEITVANGSLLDFETAGSHDITVRTTDAGGLTYDEVFTITVTDVNEAPTVDNAIADQTATEDTPFNFQFAANVFGDVDVGDTLTYTSDASGWLSFDGATRTFSGTPLNADVGTTTVTVTADDGNGGTISDTFDIVINNTNDAPTVANVIPDQVATEDTPFSFQFAANVFGDVDVGDTLTYTSDAAGWLSFDAATRTFSGTPLNGDVGTTTVTVTADDGNGGTISDTFDIVISNTNDAPTVDNAIADQTATEDTPFSFQFAANTFNDVDGDTLIYTSDASGWLSFDGATRTFSGTPLNGDVGTTTVTVTANDVNGGTISDTFDIVISNTNDAPTVDNAIADQTAIEDTPFSFQFAANVFGDVDVGDTLIYTSDAAGWLSFDAATRTFSGTPLNGDVGTTTVTVTADDGNGGTISDTFDIVISNTNDAPTVDNAIADQTATEDTPFNFQFAANVFGDVDVGDTLTYTSDASGWLSFDAATRTFSGTPLNGDVGTTTVTVTADDGNGGTISDTFDIVISNTNDAPTVDNAIADQTATEDTPFSFQFAANVFGDVDVGDTLIYTSDAAGWLSFDAATRTFSGTPLNGDVGTTTVTVTADDGNGGTISDTFDIVISNTNDAPTVDNAIADQTATEDAAFNFQFAANVFGDVDVGATLTYTSDASGWLSFDGATRTFSGTPLNADVGTTTVTVTADDGNGGTISDTFDIVISNTNDAPTVDNAIADQTATEDTPFSFQFAANTFGDVDVGDTLTYTSDASGWLSFDAATRTFSGTPLNADVGTTTVTVTADDGNGGTISDTFDIVISNTNDAPTVDNAIADQTAIEDTPFSFQFAANVFGDVDVGDTLTYTSDASGWLSFDAATRTFSGTPLNADVGTTTVTVTADDGNGGTISDTFDIVISNTNDAPTVANVIPDQVATEDSAFSFTFAANTFNDVDGDTLTYTSDAAGWLSFDAATRTFSGTPLNGDVGTTTVTVTADDGNGGTISDTFDIVISNTNDAPTVDNAIADQTATEDTLFNFQFAANVFGDVDVGDTLTYTSDASGWLSFDDATRTFSGTPLNGDVGTTTVTVTANDGNGGTISDTFDIVISNTNDAPTVDNAITDQTATEDTPFSFQFAANVFGDVDVGDTLTYTSDAAGWLSFDAATRTFSGTPLNGDVGTTTVTVTADDGNGGLISDTFDIVISNTNDAPTVANVIPDQVATEDSAFNFTFAANTFGDVDVGDTLTYTSDASGWLSFDDATRTFSGTPLNGDVGTTTVTVTANDGNGGTISDTFDIVISNTNDAPTVANVIPDQVATEDSAFNFTFAANTFGDVDVGDTLTYTSDASGWLSFDGATRTFSGTPLNGDVGTTTVTVTADDGNGGTISDTFDIVVSNTNDAPTVDNVIADQTATEDTPFNFQFAANVFGDVDVGDTLIYTSDAAGWLSFDAATRTFSGTPLNGDVGTTTVTVTADDGNGGTISDTFDIVISNTNDAPTVANVIPDQVATEDTLFNFQFAANVFNDVDGDTLTYTSDASGWLSFDGATRTFSGTPLNADVGTTTVTVTADDGNGGTISDTFDIVISNTNDAPTVANVIPDQVATEDSAFSFQFDTNTFNDVDGDTLTYTSDAAGWLSFDAATRTFSGTPLNGDVGTTTVTVTADDGNGGTISDTFDIVISNTNDAPTVDNAIADQTATEDTPFNFQFAANVFGDVDVGDTLTYTSDAAGWLSFDAATRTFSGTPLNGDVGTTTVTVTADDGNGGTISDTFDIVISNTNDAPTVDNAIADQTATEDTPFSFQFAANVFGDVDVGATLTYTSDASGWLIFDGATRTFSGTPLNGDVGTTTVTVTADDGNGGTISDTFDIVISNTNDAPTVDNAIADQTATEDTPFSFQFAANVFGDVDVGATLTYTSDASGWLSFDGATRTFSGTPLNGDVGTTTVTVTADDGNGGTISDTFDIVISNTNDAPTVDNAIADQTATEDTPFNFQFAANVFGDVDVGDTLTYTSDAAGWLSFDAATRTFSGTPLNGDVGTTTVTVTADDSNGGTISDTFDIVISNTNDAPTVDNAIADQTATEDTPFSFQFAANVFGDVDVGATLTYTSDASGWLSFDGATRTFSGTPLNGDVGTTTVTVTADDGNGGTISDTFDIVISNTNDAPTVDNAIADQTATEDTAFSFTFAANTFGDLDTSDTLIYNATLADSSPLPGWLNFDAATRTFSGTPANADVGPIDIRITADDGSSTVTDTFTLTVLNVNEAPLIGGVDSGQVNEDQSVSGGRIATSGALTIADADIGESNFVSSTINGALGALTIDTAGNWRYSADNGNPEIQALQSGESITDTLTVTTADGSTHDIVITINGAAEASPAPPPPVQPPPVEPPPEDEPPPAEEETTDAGAGQDPIIDEVVRAPQDVTPPPVQEEVDYSGYLQQEEAEADKARYSDQKDKPAVKIMELPQAQAIQQQAIQQQNLSLDELSLQVSDDETLNEKYELELLARIDSMHSGMDGDAAQTSADDVDVQIVMGSTASLTAGIVSWVLRGGSLLASFMSTVPLLNRFDPLPILKSREEKEDVEEDADDDDADTKFKQHQKRVDKLFSAKDNAREQDGYMND